MQTILFFSALVCLITLPDFMAQTLFQRKRFKLDSMFSFFYCFFCLGCSAVWKASTPAVSAGAQGSTANSTTSVKQQYY